jgi:hypothetical protein
MTISQFMGPMVDGLVLGASSHAAADSSSNGTTVSSLMTDGIND